MKLLDLFYIVKPIIPRAVQISGRRRIAAKKRKKFRAQWPIDPAAAQQPQNWKGWPENKKFALVLHHDVDGRKGLEKCARLMALEKQLGFRSAFYFVPEDYFTPRELRESLAASGFEVGVHGLRHDGKLFKSASAFYRQKPRINYYMKEWGAAGFTSPSMLRNFALMGELDIEHGCSSFDTDPFEPQAAGVRTIFPFLPADTSDPSSYVELPYTLAQDHCLFVILRENDNRIWKEKLDWIAAAGGMALLNTHPDYMNFDGTKCSREEYPASYYADLLEYIRTKYSGQFWHPLPQEMARFWRTAVPKQTDEEKTREPRPEHSKRSLGGAKIWIDLDNTPHVPFFIPVIRELERRGHRIFLSARDAFQVCELAAEKGLPITRIGRHYGRSPVKKVIGLFWRSAQLMPFWRRHKPDIALSHGSRSQILLGKCLRCPTIEIYDYEHSHAYPFLHSKWLIVPESLSRSNLHPKFFHIRHFPGIKEDVYVPTFDPDPGILDELAIHPSDIIVVLRPPADEAHYYNPESETLMVEFMSRLIKTPGARAVLLPRNRHQEEMLRLTHPGWFKDHKTIVPARALDGLNIIWHSDLVVSGGGTMNREAAALGVPVYSIFRGKTGAVDLMLEQEGRLTMIHSPEEVWTKIRIEKRTKDLLPDKAIRPALTKILFAIENIIEIERARKGSRH